MKTNLSRREFLKWSSLAASSVALPYFIPSGVLAASGRPGANDRIAVGCIGVGRRMDALVTESQALPEIKLVAFADVHLRRARTVAARFNAFACQDYRELLERKDVDAVFTATPDHWRALTCIHACQAGKDIYAEKPISFTIHEGRVIANAVRKYKRVFQTGCQQRADWTDIEGCKFIREGGLGKITRVYAWNYPGPWESALPAQPIPEGMNWDAWCGPAPKCAYNQDLYLPRANPGWLSIRPFSGGEMTGWGSHGFDMIQLALGMDAGGPTEVWTEGPKYPSLTYTQSEPKTRGDQITNVPKVFFRYPGDIVMELVDTAPNGEKPPTFGGIFVGEKGTFTIDRGRLSSDPEELAINIMSRRPKGPDGNHIANWISCIKSRKKTSADVEAGHRSATVCHLGNIARYVGRRLKWDPRKERFIGDAEANGYLDYERRKGYELPAKV
ncbi:MAG TPA: Gfo/Idh/MocA family oxidoreductase [Verrucomicrobiae bacterium]